MADDQVTQTEAQEARETWSSRFVVVGLAVVLFACVAGIIALPLFGKDAPVELPTMASMLITALAAILTPVSLKTRL